MGWPAAAGVALLRRDKHIPCLTETLACLECLLIASLRPGRNRARYHFTFYIAPVY
jgi:hypothetical protein